MVRKWSLALRVGEKAPVPLKVRVVPTRLPAPGVHVQRGAVDLPDLDERVSHGLRRGGQHAAGQMRHLADGRRNCVIEE